MLTSVRIGGTVEPWVALGLHPDDDGSTIRVGSVALRFTGTEPEGSGIEALGVLLDDPPPLIDGVPIVHDPPLPRSSPSDHPCRATVIDHVVVMTSSVERTCAAVEAGLGAPLKRTRDAGGGVQQGFHRLGEVILEVVETPQVSEPNAAVWGLVIVVEDLHAWADDLGTDLVTEPKPAVQRGRWISNVRRPAGMPCAVAFMSG